jgi:2'-5' RNA ligase
MPRARPTYTKQRPPDADAVGTPWRVFLACPLPAETQSLITELLTRLEATGLPIRWIRANSAHLTLHFLGELPVETVELLRLGVQAPLQGQPAPTLRIDGAGAFPSIREPRVVWLGLDGEVARLEGLHRRLGRALEAMEIALPREKFRPHITLGRVRQPLTPPQRDALQSALTEKRLAELFPTLGEPLTIDAVELMRSVLGRDGPTYTVLQRYPLAEIAGD